MALQIKILVATRFFLVFGLVSLYIFLIGCDSDWHFGFCSVFVLLFRLAFFGVSKCPPIKIWCTFWYAHIWSTPNEIPNTKMNEINTIPNRRPSHEATDKKWHNLSNKWSNAECATCWLTLNLSRWYQRWNGYVQVYEYLIQLSNECFVPPLFLSGKEGRFIKLISFFFQR